MVNTTINFDMDGTIADLYGVDNWLNYLVNEQSTPYKIAKPIINMNSLARKLNTLQRKGYRIAIISWLSKSGTDSYNNEVTTAKINWLKKHLASVHFDEVNIVKYGTPKQQFAYTTNDILFDDEKNNRDNWTGKAFDVQNIMEVLKTL